MPSITITRSDLNLINIISIQKHRHKWIALAQNLIKLELTIQHKSTPTPPHHLPHLPHGHPYIRKHSEYHCPTNFSPIHSFNNTWVTCSTVNAWGIHMKGGYIPAASRDSVPPPEPGGIYGTSKHQEQLLSAVDIASLFNYITKLYRQCRTTNILHALS